MPDLGEPNEEELQRLAQSYADLNQHLHGDDGHPFGPPSHPDQRDAGVQLDEGKAHNILIIGILAGAAVVGLLFYLWGIL